MKVAVLTRSRMLATLLAAGTGLGLTAAAVPGTAASQAAPPQTSPPRAGPPAAVAPATAPPATTAPATTAPAAQRPLPGSLPRWLHLAKLLTATPPARQISFGVLLGLRNQAGAAATLRSISVPGSARYGHWLSSAAFDARYAPARSDVTAVQDWLRSQGFQVTRTLPSGMLVEASGTAGQVEKVFSAPLHDYLYLGATVMANAAPLSLPAATPAAVSKAIAGIIGIDQGSELNRPAETLPGPPPGARYGVQPCSAYYGQKLATAQPPASGAPRPYAVCGYGPQQFQSAYGESGLLRSGITGRGVTVAIIGAYAAPTIFRDAQRYSQVHGQPPFTGGQFSQVIPRPAGYDMTSGCGAPSWYSEETVDVEAVHAMAPGARIAYIGAADCAGSLDDAWASAIDRHAASVITSSWTAATSESNLLGSAYVAFFEQFSLEAALTGITVSFPAGDSGDHTAGGTDLAARTVEFPADLPYVTGVGGTSLLIGSRGQWLGEYGWQDGYASLASGAWAPAAGGAYGSGGGGGTSQLFRQPFYQAGTVPVSISGSYGAARMRAVPDIALAADPGTGFLVGQTQTFPRGTYWAQYRIGGTSLAASLLAGLVAVADQYRHHPLGFANPLYYHLLRGPGLHDLTASKAPLAEVRTDYRNFVNGSQGEFYRLQTLDLQTSTLHDGPGYDDETGVGSPRGPSFFALLARR